MNLIIQSRTDQSGWHELKCMYQTSGLRYNDSMTLNVGADFVTQDMLRKACLDADTIIVGGLGEVGYGETDSAKRQWFDSIRAKTVPVLRELLQNDKTKLLGICFGHQLLAEALGAPVEPAPRQAELGVAQLHLTPTGRRDPLFAKVPASFFAITAHKDAVLTLPEDTVHLAYSEACTVQAFRYKKHIYGVQFHPEMNIDDFTFRVSLYPAYSKGAAKNTSAPKAKIAATKIVGNFLSLASRTGKVHV